MSEIKQKPILFSASMVRAILDGRKTVTRRPVKGLKTDNPVVDAFDDSPLIGACWDIGGPVIRSPYGLPGDRLYARETFMDLQGTGVEHRPDPNGPLQRYAYRADCPTGSHSDEARKDFGLKWKPSIHMPRAACRILLEITAVRVERLQDITEAQAMAEGCFFTDYGRKCGHGGNGWQEVGDCPAPKEYHPQRDGWMWDSTTSHEQCLGSARNAFGNLWNSTGGDWDANPWVWVVEFKRVTP